MVQTFLTQQSQLAIKRLFKFAPYPMCASAVPEENETHKNRR